MKCNTKLTAAVLTAVCLCSVISGCGENKSPADPSVSNGSSSTSSAIGNPANTSANTAAVPEETKPDEKKITLSDEIKNASFDSGLMQVNNTVFQLGGYITVAEFVEKYGNDFDITYSNGSYEERKDYLLEYESPKYSSYSLLMTPKNGDNKFIVNIANCISEEKITLDKAIVIDIENSVTGSAPKWAPKGFAAANANTSYQNKELGLESTNENYKLNDFAAFLEAQGLEQYVWDENASDFDKKHSLPECTLENCGKYVKVETVSIKDNYAFYVAGEPNLFGARPIYKYYISFDPNTDKVGGYITYEVETFIAE